MTRDHDELTSMGERAAHWWLLFRDGKATTAEAQEFVEWAKQAPEHVEASLRVVRVHAALERSNVRWPDTSAEELIRAARAAPLSNVLPLPPRVAPRPEKAPRPVRKLALGIAASVLGAVLIGWVLMTRPEEFQTRTGEQRSLLLADGTRVTLDSGSRIAVRMSRNHRSVELISGQALFEVALDAKRPFDVSSGNVAVQVLGTQFDIDRRPDSTVVTVVDGRVSTAVAGSSPQLATQLSAADRVVIDHHGTATVEHGVNLTEAIAWTQHRLVFHNRRLGEIAAEFNRYNTVQIEIHGVKLRDQEMTGTFRSDDVGSFVAVLAGIPGVHVARDGVGNYIITSD